MRVHLRTLSQTFDVEVSPIDTIRELLFRAQDVNGDLQPSLTTLIWKRQQLDGDRQIQSYGIMEDDTIYSMQRGPLRGEAAKYYNYWRNTRPVLDVRNVLVWEYFSITTAGREWTREFEEAKQRAERENPNPRITVVSPQDSEIAAREELTRNVTTELAPEWEEWEGPPGHRTFHSPRARRELVRENSAGTQEAIEQVSNFISSNTGAGGANFHSPRARRELVRENSAGTQEAIEQVSNFISSNTGAGGAMKNRRSSRRKNRRSSRRKNRRSSRRVYKRKIVTH